MKASFTTKEVSYDKKKNVEFTFHFELTYFFLKFIFINIRGFFFYPLKETRRQDTEDTLFRRTTVHMKNHAYVVGSAR